MHGVLTSHVDCFLLVNRETRTKRAGFFFQRFWNWVTVEIHALGFIGSFFGSSVIFGGFFWIIMREVAIQQCASELRTSKEMAPLN